MQALADKHSATESEGATRVSTEESLITWLGKFHRVEYKTPHSSLPGILTLFEKEKDAAGNSAYSEVGIGDVLNIGLYSSNYSLSSHVNSLRGLTFGNIMVLETTTLIAREVLSVQLLTPQVLERVVTPTVM